MWIIINIVSYLILYNIVPRCLLSTLYCISDIMAECLYQRYVNAGLPTQSDDASRVAALPVPYSPPPPKHEIVQRMMARKEMP